MWTNIIIIVAIGIFIAIRWQEIAFKQLVYKRVFHGNEFFADDEILATYILENRKLMPLSWIEWGAEMPEIVEIIGNEEAQYNGKGKSNHIMTTSLFSFQKLEKNVRYKIPKRGVYTFDSSNMSIGDLIGMTQAKKEYDDYKQIVVFPKVDRIENLIDIRNKPMGDYSIRRWLLADPIEIRGFREYRSEDSFKMIDWNTTAKMNQFYVKENEFKAESAVVTLLNGSTSEKHWMDVDMEAIEHGIDIIAAISNWCQSEKYPMRYETSGYCGNQNDLNRMKMSYKANQHKKILYQLATTSPGERVEFSKLIRKFNRNSTRDLSLIILSAWLNDDIIGSINALSKNGIKIKLILLKDGISKSGLLPHVECVDLKEAEDAENSK